MNLSIFPDASFIGEIESCTMPAQQVWQITSSVFDECYLIPKEYIGKTSPQKALGFGEERESVLYFYSETKYIIQACLYRHFLNGIGEVSPFLERYLRQQLDMTIEDGQIFLPAFFGYCPLPCATPNGIVTRFTKLTNGICFVQDEKNNQYLAVARGIVDVNLNSAAVDLSVGEESKPYRFYDLMTASVPLYDLIYHEEMELQQFIKSEKKMFCVLHRYFQGFCACYPVPKAEDNGEAIYPEDYLNLVWQS